MFAVVRLCIRAKMETGAGDGSLAVAGWAGGDVGRYFRAGWGFPPGGGSSFYGGCCAVLPGRPGPPARANCVGLPYTDGREGTPGVAWRIGNVTAVRGRPGASVKRATPHGCVSCVPVSWWIRFLALGFGSLLCVWLCEVCLCLPLASSSIVWRTACGL